MQNNYYFLRHLTEKLAKLLIGFQLVECYSQNKNELVLSFLDDKGEEFYIRALLQPDFCCLSFPKVLHRAKRNSVDIFDGLTGNRVSNIKQYLNERAFLMELDDDKSLLFKMHGNRSNIIYCDQLRPQEIFNSRLSNDININPAELDRPIDQSYSNFLAVEGNYTKLFPTFGKVVKQFLQINDYDNLSLESKWQLITEVLDEMERDDFFIIQESGLPQFSLLDFKEVQQHFKDPLEAVSVFYVEWLKIRKFSSRKSSIIKMLSKEIKKDHSYLQKTKEKLRRIKDDSNYRQWADLLMANMHLVKQGDKHVTVDDFYNNNQPATIPLNPTLSPQKNAERYYQKAKNQHKEIEVLEQGIRKRESSMLERQEKLNQVEHAEELDQLQVEPSKLNKPGTKKEAVPYHHFVVDGYDVLVGKGARQNDELIKKYSQKDDLWLHARAVTGSHVIIRKKGKETIPSNVVNVAAQLAAYNSKRKTDSLCPVQLTARKYIRKRKGDPPGAVVVDREDVIMVEPQSYDELMVLV